MGIHPTAIVHDLARVGPNCTVGPFSLIGQEVEIGANSTIGSHCVIGHDGPEHSRVQIGPGSCVRSHTIIYRGTSFGERLETGHHVTLREGTYAGMNFRVGTLSDIQGDCKFGDFVRMHSNVHVGKGTRLGNFVWVFPYVVFTNDPHPPSDTRLRIVVEDYSVIATMAVVLPGIQIGSHALVGAHSLVNRNVARGVLVAGVPAKERGATSDIILSDGTGRPAYPWPGHYREGFPPEVTKTWEAIFGDSGNGGGTS